VVFGCRGGLGGYDDWLSRRMNAVKSFGCCASMMGYLVHLMEDLMIELGVA